MLALEKELAVRELFEPMFKSNMASNERKQYFQRPMDQNKEGTATALHACTGKREKNCAYCLGDHKVY